MVGEINIAQKYFGNERIHEINYNKHNTKMTIEEYKNAKDIRVRFLDGNNYISKTTYIDFKSGYVNNVFDKTVCNIGFLGAKYDSPIDISKYEMWREMIRRCYDMKFQEKWNTYKGCTVCEEWHNFSNFLQWYNSNYYKIDNEKMVLDKDILLKGNKIYSPETCLIIPEYINLLFLRTQKSRGKFPIGVYYDKDSKSYKAQLNYRNKRKNLGRYKTPEEAFNIYKIYKMQLIKDIAEEYINIIPQRAYIALHNYTVEITD